MRFTSTRDCDFAAKPNIISTHACFVQPLWPDSLHTRGVMSSDESVTSLSSTQMDHEDDLWDNYGHTHTPIINRIYVMADVEDSVCSCSHRDLL